MKPALSGDRKPVCRCPGPWLISASIRIADTQSLGLRLRQQNSNLTQLAVTLHRVAAFCLRRRPQSDRITPVIRTDVVEIP